MASSLHKPLLLSKPCFPLPCKSLTSSTYTPIRCGGPRSQRGPLVKGRILSIEAIQAIQTLKRIQRTNPSNLLDVVSKTLSRLIKSDLLATLKELLRQDQCALALQVFSIFRSEYKADLSLYSEMVQGLARNGMGEDIDCLMFDLEGEGGIDCEDKGLISLIKGVIGAKRRESTVRIYRLMKKSGWGSSVMPDEYVVNVLSGGLKRFGEEALADEARRECEKAFPRFSRGYSEKLRL